MKKKDYIYVVALLGFIVDQVVKFIVRDHMQLLESIPVISKFFSITYVENQGAAWGILGNATIFLVIISLAVFYLVLRFIQEEKVWNHVKIFSFGFLLSGIVGNLIDRILYHSVTDYLDFCIFNYNFPVFNIADIMIVVGGLFIAGSLLRSEIDERRSRKSKC